MDQRTDRALLLILLFITIPIFSSSLPSEKTTSFLSSTSTPLPSDSAPQYQSLPILQDDSGLFYINVTWKNASVHPFYSNQDTALPSNFQDYPAMNNGKLVLAFYTNLSFVSTCQNFLQYECGLLDCQVSNYNEIDSSFLYDGTELEGFPIGIGIESSAFNMDGYSAILASSCGEGFPVGFSGFLGFGFSLNAFFEVNRNFSVFLSNGNDGLNSTLFVGPDNDQDLIDSTDNFQQWWNTDTNWTVNVIGASAQVEGKPGSIKAAISLAEGYKALFDINTDAIAMPAALFNNLTSVLQSYGVDCNASPYQPSCTYNGDTASLPTFYFDLDDNESAIEIKPQVYFVQSPDQDTSYTLMFAAMASGIPGALQVSPQYNTSIILGRPFMTFYYVHFSLCEDYVQPYVTLYYANHNITTPQSNTKTILIIVGSSLAFVLLVVAVICIIVRRRRKTCTVFKIEDERATVDTYTWTKKDIESINKTETLNQPLVHHSMSSENSERKSKKGKKKVWSNEGFVDPNEINAYTYQKQKYRGLYESDCDSFSLNNEIGAESH